MRWRTGKRREGTIKAQINKEDGNGRSFGDTYWHEEERSRVREGSRKEYLRGNREFAKGNESVSGVWGKWKCRV